MVKLSGPKVTESEEAAAARERAETDAEERKVGEIRRGVSNQTASILRRFGIRAAAAGSPTAGSFAGNAFSGGVNPSAASGNFNFDFGDFSGGFAGLVGRG